MGQTPNKSSSRHPARGGESSCLAIVSGQVQGVGFRYFVLRRARQLGLSGSVRNLPGGQVEVRAAGARDELNLLLEDLRRGPLFSRVEDVTVNWNVPVDETGEFIIGS